MPWRVALENIKDVQEFYLDIPGFSPGTTAYEAKFPSGQEGTRMVHNPEQMREELDSITWTSGFSSRITSSNCR